MRLGLALTSALLLLAASAHAEPRAARIVRHLDRPDRPHPLADARGRIPVTARIPKGRTAESVGLWQVAPGIGARRLLPSEIAPFAALHPDLALSISPPRKPLLDVSGKWTNVGGFRELTGLDGAGVIVGIVDTGIDIRHPDFRDDEGKTRIAWLLANGAPAGLHADLEERFGCTDPEKSACAVYSKDDIDAVLEGHGTFDTRDLEGHGTHVASIAAGNGGPSVTSKPKYVGVAPAATLVIAAPFDAGGFADADILNAATFVFDRAEALGMPAVVNLSVGGDYGSHDGKSSLELGLSALVGDDQPGRAIVVAAGNSGTLNTDAGGGGPYGIHTEVSVSSNEVARVPILASGADDGKGFVWITFQPGDEIDVALEGPDGSRWIGFMSKGEDAGYASGTGKTKVQAGVVNNVPEANAAMTSEMNSATVTLVGHWTAGTFNVLLRGEGHASLWIQATGDAEGGLQFGRALRAGTINVPASAPDLIAVGCTVNRIKWKPLAGEGIVLDALGADTSPVADGACYFSSDGPTPGGTQKPEISAPGGFVAAAMSADADPRTHPGGMFDMAGCPDDGKCAVVDERHALAAGTSMSAPHVTGAIALLMSIDPTLTQARAVDVLQAGARRPTGHVPDAQQLGPGEIDLVAAREALLDPTAPPADPDPTKSWYTLSSSFARPDPTWPVWGTIELRKLDGSIAGGVDGKQLELSVDGGVVLQPITRVARGLYRFAIAGQESSDGEHIRVEVSYAGMSLGAVDLPVGADAWRAQDPDLGAVSGACSIGRGAGGGALATMIAAALLAWAWRRRP